MSKEGKPMYHLMPTAYLRWNQGVLEQMWATSDGVQRWAKVPELKNPEPEKKEPEPYIESAFLN